MFAANKGLSFVTTRLRGTSFVRLSLSRTPAGQSRDIPQPKKECYTWSDYWTVNGNAELGIVSRSTLVPFFFLIFWPRSCDIIAYSQHTELYKMQVLHPHLKRTDYADSESRKKKEPGKINSIRFIHSLDQERIKWGSNEENG